MQPPKFIETKNHEFLKIDRFYYGKFFIQSPELIYDILTETFYDRSTSNLIDIELKARHPKFWKDWFSARRNK